MLHHPRCQAANRFRHGRCGSKLLRRLQFECLEIRNLLAVSAITHAASLLSSELCKCPICTGQGLTVETNGQLPSSESSQPAASLSALSSNPGATAKLYLDFDGDYQETWGSYSNITTPAYDTDVDSGNFST